MDNILSTIRNNRRVTCAWVPTGNLKTPLECVWTEAQPSLADCPDRFSPNEEGGEIRFVYLEEVAHEVATTRATEGVEATAPVVG